MVLLVGDATHDPKTRKVGEAELLKTYGSTIARQLLVLAATAIG